MTAWQVEFLCRAIAKRVLRKKQLLPKPQGLHIREAQSQDLPAVNSTWMERLGKNLGQNQDSFAVSSMQMAPEERSRGRNPEVTGRENSQYKMLELVTKMWKLTIEVPISFERVAQVPDSSLPRRAWNSTNHYTVH